MLAVSGGRDPGPRVRGPSALKPIRACPASIEKLRQRKKRPLGGVHDGVHDGGRVSKQNPALIKSRPAFIPGFNLFSSVGTERTKERRREERRSRRRCLRSRMRCLRSRRSRRRSLRSRLLFRLMSQIKERIFIVKEKHNKLVFIVSAAEIFESTKPVH
ncbi:uncharacterized protein V6R79_016781 [Siganus canaliculatus]